jgi:ankyrin repeat protein
MMAQNTSEDKVIADLDSHEPTKPSESVGAVDDFLKQYFDRRDQLPKPSTIAGGYDSLRFLSKRGKIYEEALKTARALNDTRSENEREENYGKIEDRLVGAVKEDFKAYPKVLPKCRSIVCWAARLGLQNIVVGLVRARGADDQESLTPMSKGLLALAIAAENNNVTMVDALEDIAVSDERFISREPHLFSPNKERNLFYSECATPVHKLYPSHEFWLCPIEAAARLGRVEMVEKLINMREAKMMAEVKARVEAEAKREAKREAKVEAKIEAQRRQEMRKKELLEAMMRDERTKCRRAFDWAVKMGHGNVVELLINRKYIVDLNDACTVPELLDNTHVKSYGSRQTPLALAVLSAHFEVVKCLCEATIGGLRTDVQTEKGNTAIEMAFKEIPQRSRVSNNPVTPTQASNEIWKQIMERADSRRELKRLTEERKVHVDAINAILVGTALIATATFAGWLSPPLGYSSPPGTDGPFASVGGHPILESFWVFNSLSFFFSIATFMVGANVALPPREDIYIGDVVQALRWKLTLAYCLVSAAVFFVMGAFASAGFAVLPPIPKYTVNMALTVGIGVTVVAVVVFSTFFGQMFTKSGWQELKHKMKFRCWQQPKHEMESNNHD